MNLNKKTTMKKAFALMLTLVMSLSLVACGGVDTTSAVEAFNSASARMDEIGEMANPNAALLGDEFMGEMIAVSEEMAGLKTELESEDITQERVDEIQSISEEYLVTIDDFETRIEEMLADPSLAKIQTINEMVIELTDAYNEVAPLAIENGWENDELTVEELNTLGAFLETAQADDFDDMVAALDEAQLDDLIEQCQLIQDAMPALSERVSQPYIDEE